MFHGCELWGVGDVEKELEDVTFATVQVRLLEEQMAIMVLGGGFVQLKIEKKSGKGTCEECHLAFADYLEHLKHHVKWARGMVEKAGGMPDKPPLPSLLLHRPKFKLPPVLSEDQGSTSVTRYIRLIEEKAQMRVEKGQVVSQYGRVGAVAVPEINRELVGRHIEYIFNDDAAKGTKGRKKKLLYVHTAAPS